MRKLTAKMARALLDPVNAPVYLYVLEHPSGIVRLWSGIGTAIWNGDEFTGAGKLLSVSPIEDRSEVAISRVVFRLAGVQLDQAALDLITTQAYRVPLTLYWALVDDRLQIIPDPLKRFRGFADPASITEDEEGGRVIELPVEGALFNLLKPTATELSHEEQQRRFPGDTGLERMSKAPGADRRWIPGSYNNFSPPL